MVRILVEIRLDMYCHRFVGCAETDDLEFAIWWKTLDEKLHGVFSHLDFAPTHRTTAVYDENIKEFVSFAERC